jgi:hypothetical protein
VAAHDVLTRAGRGCAFVAPLVQKCRVSYTCNYLKSLIFVIRARVSSATGIIPARVHKQRTKPVSASLARAR